MQQENFTNKELQIINKAYAFAKANLYILPGEPGKKFPRNGLAPGCTTVSYNIKDYSDVGALTELFKKYPDSNIIKLNGNGFLSVVIDIDKKDGKFSNEALVLIELLKDYPTYVVETPSGGFHYHYIIDPARPLVGRIVGYKDGVDIILDGASPLPPAQAGSDKLGAIGEYTEKDSIDLQPITQFPYEEFLDLIDTPENRNNGQVLKTNWKEIAIKKNLTGERNDPTVRVAGKLIRHLPPEDWDTIDFDLLRGYDLTHNDPPLSIEWGEQDLRTKWEGIKKAELQQGSREILEVVDTTSVTQKFGDPPVVFWNQLQDWKIPETSFLVNNLIVERGINYIYGKPGVCKTWLAQYLALCIARGTPAFGRFLTKQCKVLFVDKDNDPYQMKLRVESLGGLDTDQVGYYLDAGLFRVENEEAVKKLLACIKKHGFGLVVFDTSRDIHKGEEDSSTEMDRVNQVFKRILQIGCGVLAISHTKKKDDGDLIDLMRGSTAISGSAASMIHVKQLDDNTIILEMGKSRYVKKIEPMELKILQNGQSITGFEYVGIAKAEPNDSNKKDWIVEKILRLVKGISGLSRRELVQAIQQNGKPSESTIDRKIDFLVSVGTVKKVGEGKDMIIKEKSG